VINAVEFDALLGLGLTPEFVAAIKERNTTELTDQMDAAMCESIALMETVEAAHGNRQQVQAAAYTTVDEWIRLGVIDTLLLWIDGRARTCIHAPDPLRPQPVWTAAWKPGLVVCTRCIGLLKAVGVADRTCDCCGHICVGVDSDDPVFTSTVWLGALAYQFGTCRGCVPECASGTT